MVNYFILDWVFVFILILLLVKLVCIVLLISYFNEFYFLEFILVMILKEKKIFF